MKTIMLKTINIIMILVILVLATAQIQAQTTTDNFAVSKPGGGYFFSFSGAIDSAETIWSQTLSFRDNDGFSYTTFPWSFGYDLAAADSIVVGCYAFCSYDNTNWIVADTLFNATSATATKGTATLNNVKAPYWKIKIVNADGSKANTSLKLGVLQPVKD